MGMRRVDYIIFGYKCDYHISDEAREKLEDLEFAPIREIVAIPDYMQHKYLIVGRLILKVFYDGEFPLKNIAEYHITDAPGMDHKLEELIEECNLKRLEHGTWLFTQWS